MTFARTLLAGSLLAGLYAVTPSAAAAQTSMLGGPQRVSTAPSQSCARQSYSIPRGKAMSIDFPNDVREAQVTDPATANVRLHTPRRFSILGLAPGQTDAAFYDALGRCSLVVDIRVEQDVTGLMDTIQAILPGTQVRAQAANDSIILTGLVPSLADSDRVVQVARRYVSRPDLVLNMLAIAGRDQVMLNVRVVEVNRSVIKQLGFNTNAIFGQLGGNQIAIGNTPTFAVNGGFQGGFSGGGLRNTTSQPLLAPPSSCLDSTTIDTTNMANCVGVGRAGSDGVNQAQALLQAFERQGLVRTLAEPSATTVSGESAKFLAGGEYPVPSGRDSQGNTIIEFKPYGVGLGFTPVVLSGGRISLKVSVEVSELTTAGALTLAGLAGAGTSAVIPALSVRRAENTVELSSGGSIQIAGLLQESTRQNLDKIPGIADVPILGALARSRDYLKSETELVIIVTAYLVDQTSPDKLQTPADGLRIASDVETNLLGRLNHAYKTDPGAPAAVAGRSYEGPIGHVID